MKWILLMQIGLHSNIGGATFILNPSTIVVSYLFFSETLM